MYNFCICLVVFFTPIASFPISPFSLFGRDYPEVYFPNGTHSVISISAFGDVVELEDGSKFRISPAQAQEIAKWKASDPILVTQNHRLFSPFEYRLINQAIGSILEAEVCEGPEKNGPYTKWISAIDSYRGEISLSDGTSWQVSSYDMNYFNGWEVGDPVILGYNSGGDKEYLGILINVPMQQQSIRVGQL